MNHAIAGVFSAAATPIDADGRPNHGLLASHCHTLLEDGCDGLAVLGTTGEANSFSGAERRALLEGLAASGIPAARMLPGVGVCALSESVELARHALDIGVENVLVLPPFYYKGVPDDGLFAYYSEFMERVGDSRLRVLLYHIPPISQVPLSLDLIGRLVERFGSAIAGVKDSSGDLANMTALAAAFPQLSIMAGADPLMLPLLAQGGAGCITATSNLVAADLAFIYAHHGESGRKAEVDAAQERVVAMRGLVSRYQQIASIKCCLAERYGDAGWHGMRAPLLKLEDGQRREIAAAYRSAMFNE